MEYVIFSANAVLPVFAIILAGIFLKRKKVLTDSYVQISNNVVYLLALPALIFRELSAADFNSIIDLKLIILGVSGTFAAAAIAWTAAPFLSADKKQIGPCVQGAFRANLAIVGLALVFNLGGQAAVSMHAFILAILMPLYNILSVIALTVHLHKGSGLENIKKIIKEIAGNPLMITIALSIPFSIFHIKIPQFIDVTLGYLGKLSLPLALLAIGASMRFQSLRQKGGPIFTASLIKIILLPGIMTLIALWAGLRGTALSVAFITFASPTALVSYVMADAMGNDSEVASGIIVVTTSLSVLTIGGGIAILKYLQFL